MPKLFMRSDDNPKLGDTILARIGFTTIGAVWSLVSKSGEIVAKARVTRSLSKGEFADTPKYIDPRSDQDRDDTFDSGKNVFALFVERTNEDEILY